jgi:cobalamin biosynthesis Mg chelatase CobN
MSDDMFQRAAAADEDTALNFIRKHAMEMEGEVGTRQYCPR